ncbi:MAG: NADH-quinone oxidoreductase subunit NuoK [Bacteroidia bacterium]|nr:NADH-quinone oxidoreductase subunit NuoK [Bacteroidia bacterium]
MNNHIFFLISLCLFCIGWFLVLTRRNGVAALIGIELILNAANINFVAFSRNDSTHDGQIFALFVIVLAAAEAAIALAIVLNLYDRLHTVNLDEANQLKE